MESKDPGFDGYQPVLDFLNSITPNEAAQFFTEQFTHQMNNQSILRRSLVRDMSGMDKPLSVSGKPFDVPVTQLIVRTEFPEVFDSYNYRELWSDLCEGTYRAEEGLYLRCLENTGREVIQISEFSADQLKDAYETESRRWKPTTLFLGRDLYPETTGPAWSEITPDKRLDKNAGILDIHNMVTTTDYYRDPRLYLFEPRQYMIIANPYTHGGFRATELEYSLQDGIITLQYSLQLLVNPQTCTTYLV